MSSRETAFENALDDFIEALNDIARKRMLSLISVSEILHIVARAIDHTMLGVMGSKDAEGQSEDGNERSDNN